MDWGEFFHMGGYAFFVWWSYGISLFVLGWVALSPLWQRRRIIAQIKRAIRREQLERDRKEAAS